MYVSATSKEALDEVPFEETIESYQGAKHHYKVGWIQFKDVLNIDWNARQDLFLAVLPDGIQLNTPELEHAIVHEQLFA